MKNRFGAAARGAAALCLGAALLLVACVQPAGTPTPTSTTTSQPSAESATEQARCTAGGGTWDTGSERIPAGYCAKGTEAQCRAQGGNWQRVCLMGTLACVKPYPDAGKSCTDGSQCAGKRCLAPQSAGSIPGQGPMQGQCIANDNPCYFGINLEKGFTVPTPVAD